MATRGEDLLEEDQVAEELGVKVATMGKWRTNGEGPAFVKAPGFRAPRYRRRDLDDWKASLRPFRSTVESRLAYPR